MLNTCIIFYVFLLDWILLIRHKTSSHFLVSLLFKYLFVTSLQNKKIMSHRTKSKMHRFWQLILWTGISILELNIFQKLLHVIKKSRDQAYVTELWQSVCMRFTPVQSLGFKNAMKKKRYEILAKVLDWFMRYPIRFWTIAQIRKFLLPGSEVINNPVYPNVFQYWG